MDNVKRMGGLRETFGEERLRGKDREDESKGDGFKGIYGWGKKRSRED